MNDAIDRAAVDAGRGPLEIRRLYNLNGSFGSGGGFLRGAPEEWVEQLAGLTTQAGISTFLLAADDEETMRRFATEVVPGVRWRVQQAREAAASAPQRKRRSRLRPRHRRRRLRQMQRRPARAGRRSRSRRRPTTGRASATRRRGRRARGRPDRRRTPRGAIRRSS
jgi:hypothetical protein